MKRKLLATLCVSSACLFAFTGCGQNATLSLDGSYWLKSSTDSSVGTVYEKAEYVVSVDTSSATTTTLTPCLTGTYVTQLENTQLDGIDCYKYSTSLSVTGYYENASTKAQTQVNDSIESTVYFLSKADSLKPLKSEKSVVSTSPTADENTFITVNYSYVTVYDGDKANVSFTYNDENTTTVFSNHNKEFSLDLTGASVDNDQMIFAVRGMKIGDKFSTRFDVVEQVGATVYSVNVSANSENATDTIVIPEYTETVQGNEPLSETDKKFSVDRINFTINSSYSGASITVYYAQNTDTNKNRHRPIRIKNALPYGIGDIVYTLKAVTVNA